jgi:hypothetical protein
MEIKAPGKFETEKPLIEGQLFNLARLETTPVKYLVYYTVNEEDLSDNAIVIDYEKYNDYEEWAQAGYVMLVGWCEVQCSQPTLRVAGGIQLETVVSALVVTAEGRYSLGDFVPVSPYQLADGQHGRIHETELGVLLEGLFEQPRKRWKRFVAMLDKLRIGWKVEVVFVVGVRPAPDILEEFLWCGERAE